jgi:hypothetical protein
MGREVKRVPMDFAHPMKQTWPGYLNPHRSTECGTCSGEGVNAPTRVLAASWYDHDGFGSRWTYQYGTGRDGKPAERAPWKIVGDCRSWSHDLTQEDVDALVEAGRLMDFTHTWRAGEGWKKKDPPYRPSAAEVNEWSYHGMGHDSINKHVCVEARAKRMGLYGQCEACGGDGEIWPSPEVRAASEAWEPTEPPVGEGWQMWETTSEGSPMSPVFATPEELARWLADTGTSSFGRDTATYDQWLSMIRAGWAISAVAIDGQMMSGVAACEPLSGDPS